MAVVIKAKNASTGTPASLAIGELAVNTTNGKLWVGSNVSGVIPINSGTTQLIAGTADSQTLRWDAVDGEWQPVDALKTSETLVTVSGTGGLITETGLQSTNPGGATSFRAGFRAGHVNQASRCVAIGHEAGETDQQQDGVAIGISAGNENQGLQAVAMGLACGAENQGTQSVAIGTQAGRYEQGPNSVAIGTNAANQGQDSAAIAIGASAGILNQKLQAIAIGLNAGKENQGIRAIALGFGAGKENQGESGIIINTKNIGLEDSTVGHIHIQSSLASLDFTNTNGWTATDAAGTFPLRSTSLLATDNTWTGLNTFASLAVKPLAGEALTIGKNGPYNHNGLEIWDLASKRGIFDGDGIKLQQNGVICWSPTAVAGANDTCLFREDIGPVTGTFAMRSGAIAQNLNMYNTYSGSGYQRGYMRNTNLGFFIGTESSGSSAQRDLILTNPNGIVGLMGTGGVETIFTKEALQDVVAASSDFANFKVNVAAL